MKGVFAGVLFLLFAGEAIGASADEIMAAWLPRLVRAHREDRPPRSPFGLVPGG